MKTCKVFVIGAPTQYEDMIKLGEYEKNLLKRTCPDCVASVTVAELKPDVTDAEIIKKNIKNISESNVVLALKREDGTFDKDTTYLMAFAEFLGKCTVVPVRANFCNEI